MEENIEGNQKNNVLISQISLRDSIFTKDNIKYDIIIKYPEGSSLRNYNDDQYPVIPFCWDEDSIKNDINFQNILKNGNINHNKAEQIENNNAKENNSEENNDKKSNIENNELNKNINDFNFQNQSIELKDKIFVLNSQSEQNDDIKNINNDINKNNEELDIEKNNIINKDNNENNIELENGKNKIINIDNTDMNFNQEKEENKNIDKDNINLNIKQENGEKEINELNFDNVENSKNNQDTQKNFEINNLNSLEIENDANKEKNIDNESINQNQNNQELNHKKENGLENKYNENMLETKSQKGSQNDNKDLNEDIEFNINIDNKNSLEKKDAFSQTKNKENGLLNEIHNENNGEIKNENNEYFEQKLKSGNQTLDSDENPNNKKVRRNKNYNQKILNNKNLLIQNKDNIQNKSQKRQKNKDKKNLNKMLLEKEMNEIKKKLEQKKKRKEKKEKESEKAANDYIKFKNKILDENYQNIYQKQLSKETNSNRLSLENDDIYEKFNTPSNNDICSQLLKSTMNNEKQLLLVPYAKKKEKIKKTFNTIAKLNGVSYSEFRVIKGTEMDNNNIYNIIRDDDRKSLSKRKDYSETNSARRSNYSNFYKFKGDNSDFKL